jgi:hypothetical protein
VRSSVVIFLAAALCGCSLLEQVDFGGRSLDPNKIYVSPTAVVSVAQRQIYRYACVDRPLLCVQHGVNFECRCP